MKKILLSLAIASSFSAYAQTELKEKKMDITSTSELVYHINDSKLKEGAFYVNNLANKGVWLRGSYKDGEKSGNWYFFNADNKMMLRYNFTDKKVLYLDPQFYNAALITIESDDLDIKKNATVPIPLFPMDLLLSLASSDKETAKKISDNSNPDKLNFVIYIDENGEAKYNIETLDNKSVANNIRFEVKEAKVQWLPSTLNGKNYASKISITLNVQGLDAINNQKARINWNY